MFLFITITHAIFPNKPFCLRILQMFFWTNFLQILQIVIPDRFVAKYAYCIWFYGQFLMQSLPKSFGHFLLIVLPDNSLKLLQVTFQIFLHIFVTVDISCKSWQFFCTQLFRIIFLQIIVTDNFFKLWKIVFFCNQVVPDNLLYIFKSSFRKNFLHIVFKAIVLQIVVPDIFRKL